MMDHQLNVRMFENTTRTVEYQWSRAIRSDIPALGMGAVCGLLYCDLEGSCCFAVFVQGDDVDPF